MFQAAAIAVCQYLVCEAANPSVPEVVVVPRVRSATVLTSSSAAEKSNINNMMKTSGGSVAGAL